MSDINIDMLKEGIGLRAYGQKDPLIEYKKEAYDLFNKMMFEIQSNTVRYLFRAKRIDNGEWVFGNYAFCDCYTKQQHYIFQNKPLEFAIDETTICQYTGLTDKNGNKIWENDIVKDNVVFGTVVWDEKYAQFMIDDEFDGHQDYSDWWGEVEVIGNIFDNPELLGGQ